MDFLLDPNVVYVLLVLGSILLMLAIVSPGTHVIELVTLLLLAAAGYGVYSLGFNLWALIVLVVSLVPFVYAIQKPKREPWLALSLAGLIVGSVYIFPSKGFIPLVNPFVAVVISALAAGFTWLVIRNSIKAYHAHPFHDLYNLIGRTGQAKTRLDGSGSVQVAGELWSARSEQPIAEGSRVRVLKREGFTLVVALDDQAGK
jgi:membrane-bound serine protease (ClpP class)